MGLNFNHVSFAFDSASQPLFEDINVNIPGGWTGIVGANGTGKTTFLRLASGELQASAGNVMREGQFVFCSQRTDLPPEKLWDFLLDMDREANRLRGQLEIEWDWPNRWDSLSHGERKRAQIAVALWQAPHILAVDEPNNHLDENAKGLIFKTLAAFRGTGLLVSHDRELLDNLCRHCLFTSPPSVTLRPGNYTDAMEQATIERNSHHRERQQLKVALARLDTTQKSRKHEAAQADHKRSKKKISKKDHDAKERIGRARITGKDGRAGALTRQLDGRMRQLTDKLSRTTVEKQHRTGVQLPAQKARQTRLLSLPKGTLMLGEDRQLNFQTLFIEPNDRIGITGNNGSGKSSLVAHILKQLLLPKDRIVYLPQEISMTESLRILRETRALSYETQGNVFTTVNRLGTRPERLLETEMPSPGEMRKLLLALGMAKSPALIVMDEPTNHLDLPAVLALESALDACPCALLLVSHDRRFLEKLTQKQWHLANDTLTESYF